jgi:hypothetical protein
MVGGGISPTQFSAKSGWTFGKGDIENFHRSILIVLSSIDHYYPAPRIMEKVPAAVGVALQEAGSWEDGS